MDLVNPVIAFNDIGHHDPDFHAVLPQEVLDRHGNLLLIVAVGDLYAVFDRLGDDPPLHHPGVAFKGS